MPWFRVDVEEGDLETADRALLSAGIRYRQTVYAEWVTGGPPSITSVGAVVEADTRSEAEAVVLEALPSESWKVSARELRRRSE